MPRSAAKLSPCYCFNFRTIARTLTHFYDHELAPSGLPLTQYSLLSHVSGLGPLSMHALSEAMHLERTTLVRNLNVLAKRDLVVISGTPGSRAGLVRITSEGRTALEAARPLWRAAQDKLHGLLTAEERAALPGIMGKLRDLHP